MKNENPITFHSLKVFFIAVMVLLAGKQTFAQIPANDGCGTATTLTPALACTATPGTLKSATVSLPAVASACTGTAGADVWYKFVATSVYPNITLSATGSSLGTTNARIQLLSGACGSPTSLGCVTGNFFSVASNSSTGLTIGTTYLIRIYSTTLAPTGGSVWDFSICVQDAPANDLCTNAPTLTSSTTCSATAGTLNNAAVSNPAITTGCGTAGGDVWYKFIAQSAYPTIALSGTGSSLGTSNGRIQLFSGSCGSLTSLGCVSAHIFNTSITYPTGLTVGTTYYVRIYSNTLVPVAATAGAWDFSICVTDPPANDDCANAVLLTSGTSCSNTAGTQNSATYIGSGITACSGTDRYDLWYKFVAQKTNPTVTISSLGSSFINQRIQVLGGTCGSFSLVGCSSAGTPNTYTAAGLTVGNTYYVRVFSTSSAAIPNSNADFNICITDPAGPVNDNCAFPTTLTPGSTCSNTAGTLLNATGTAGIPGDCGAVGSPEVWYNFIANSAYPTITLSSVGALFTAAGPRLQLLSGSCGSFTSLACVSGTSMNTFAASSTPLIIGNTYYIRVYTNSAVMSGTTWNFNICMTNQATPNVEVGKSYVNITKGSGGGTIEPGDELEMRTTISVRNSWAFNPSFTGMIPANTTYVPGTLRILTNEGLLYKQFTDAADGDPATITGSTVNFNLGAGATQTIGGIIKNTDRPVGGGGSMIIVSYHVIVNAVSYGSLVSVGGGSLSYSNSIGTVSAINFPAVTAIVYKNYGICTNTIGGNAILSENGGTFSSGNTKDRAASANVPSNYTYTTFSTSGPGDYYYAVSNNTSPSTSPANYSINPNDPVAAHHVYNVWDIIGDHTGATNPLAGNLPADVNSGQSGGYMVVINASYRTDTAFLDTVKNLCPNTSYEYSAWFRNICRKCGVDSTGAGPSSGVYVPTGPGDSSGVHPNLTFNLNGYDYYTTGDMGYTGQWVKKGFTYRTGPSETQMIINIRNNAPGGGGNDWAIDDIGVATCTPNLDLNPSTSTVNLCLGNAFTLSAAVRSFFDNYTQYIWEKSVDSGATYTSVGFSGTGSPAYNGTEYVYTANGPSFIGDSSQNNNVYRLRVASTATNINDPNCSFAATRTVKIYVHNCLYLLNADFVNVFGNIARNFSTIQWSTVNETAKTSYELEKSTDGIHFAKIAAFKANGQNGNGMYVFNDPVALAGQGYYRVKLMQESGAFKYSKIILLSPEKINLAIQNLVNPFSNTVHFDLILPAAGDIRATIFDNYGRAVKVYTQKQVSKGVTAITVPDINNLASGLYTLKVEWQQESISKRIIKMDK